MSRPAQTSSTTRGRDLDDDERRPRADAAQPSAAHALAQRVEARRGRRAQRRQHAERRRPSPASGRPPTTSAGRSTEGVSVSGSDIGMSRASSGTEATATRTPSAPPSRARSRLSVTSCRTRRSRPAPSAARSSSSRLLAYARASSRFARLAQAISSTEPTPRKRVQHRARAVRVLLAELEDVCAIFVLRPDTPLQPRRDHARSAPLRQRSRLASGGR